MKTTNVKTQQVSKVEAALEDDLYISGFSQDQINLIIDILMKLFVYYDNVEEENIIQYTLSQKFHTLQLSFSIKSNKGISQGIIDDTTQKLKQSTPDACFVFNILKYEVSKGNVSYHLIFKKEKNTIMRNYRFIFKHTRGIKKYTAIFSITRILSLIVSVMAPLVLGTVIVQISKNSVGGIFFVALVLFGLKVFESIINLIATNMANKMYFAIKRDVGSYITDKCMHIKKPVIDKRGAGQFVQLLSVDIENASQGIEGMLDKGCFLFQTIGVIIAIAFLDPYMFSYSVIGLLVFSIIDAIRMKKFYVNGKSYKMHNDRYSNNIVGMVNGLNDIKVLKARAPFLEKLMGYLNTASTFGYKMYKVNNNYECGKSITRSIFTFGYITLIAIGVSRDKLFIEVALILMNYLPLIFDNFSIHLANLLNVVKDFNLSVDRILYHLSQPEKNQEQFGKEVLKDVQGHIEFKNVSFSYENSVYGIEKPTIKNISFSAKPNTVSAIVGKTGSGKSTIMNLIPLLYDNYEGEILIDGHEIRNLTEDSLRTSVSYIRQDSWLFDASIKDNLLLAKPDATDAELREVCKICCIDQDIMAFENGYETVLESNGTSISGGQKQRISLARCLLQDNPILLFDEATSALDNITQHSIMANIKEACKDKTIIIVAHRLSTIKDAHNIIVINNSKVEAQGTHEELLKCSPLYKDMNNNDNEKVGA